MHTERLLEAILSTLAAGGTVVTVNQRLSRHWEDRLAHWQREQGSRAWQSPQILPFQAWMERWWQQGLDQALLSGDDRVSRWPRRLTSWQERVVWGNIVATSEVAEELFLPRQSVFLAMEARQLIREWRLPWGAAVAAHDREAEVFASWLDRFETWCREHHRLPMADLPSWMSERLDGLVLPNRVMLLGFDEPTPLQNAWFDVLAAKGVRVEREPPSLETDRSPPRIYREMAPDGETEARWAAIWARECLRADSEAVVAVVVPDLARRREVMERCFQEVFAPGGNWPGQGERHLPYNVSLGGVLADQPVVRDAGRLLRLAMGTLIGDEGYRCLRSPFWGGGMAEWLPRAELEARLRKQGKYRLGLADLRQSSSTPILVERLRRLTAALAESDLEGRASCHDWSERFNHWLSLLGWPGDRPLLSVEYQAVQALRRLLAELSRLDEVIGEESSPGCDGRWAMREWWQQVESTLFQPEGGAEAKIQILGLLEAEGVSFDALRLVGMTDEEWPAAPMPNPFLPCDWQRRQGLPRSSAARELAFARRVTNRLLQSAREVVISYPGRDGDRPLRVSPLVAAWPTRPETWSEALLQESMPAVRIWRAGAREVYQDSVGPPRPASVVTEGGSGMLQSQANCPFQAFARYRLRADPLPIPQPDLEPSVRGQLVHKAVYHFWSRVSALRLAVGPSVAGEGEELPWEEVAAAAEEAARQAVRWAAGQWPDQVRGRRERLERQRLANLLMRFWGDLEAKRDRSYRVEALEAPRTLQLGRLQVRLCLDRMDRIDGGGLVVLDYKTGRSSASGWFGEAPLDPPVDPQLPLYGLVVGEEAQALAFVQLRPEKLAYVGLARTPGLLPGGGVKDFRETTPYGDWGALLAYWRSSLTRLGERYLAGEAAVAPIGQVCRECDLAGLCRVTGATSTPEVNRQTVK